MVKTMAKLRMAHASTHGARKPPGPKLIKIVLNSFFPHFRNIFPEIIDKEKCTVVNKGEDDLCSYVDGQIVSVVLEQSGNPVGDDEPDSNRGHYLVT